MSFEPQVGFVSASRRDSQIRGNDPDSGRTGSVNRLFAQRGIKISRSSARPRWNIPRFSNIHRTIRRSREFRFFSEIPAIQPIPRISSLKLYIARLKASSFFKAHIFPFFSAQSFLRNFRLVNERVTNIELNQWQVNFALKRLRSVIWIFWNICQEGNYYPLSERLFLVVWKIILKCSREEKLFYYELLWFNF